MLSLLSTTELHPKPLSQILNVESYLMNQGRCTLLELGEGLSLTLGVDVRILLDKVRFTSFFSMSGSIYTYKGKLMQYRKVKYENLYTAMGRVKELCYQGIVKHRGLRKRENKRPEPMRATPICNSLNACSLK
jgi:hypothetical protein